RRRGRHLPRPGGRRGPGDRLRHRRAWGADRGGLGAAPRGPNPPPETGAAGRAPGARAALKTRWLVVAKQPEPIAFVGFETSEPDHFGLASVSDPARTFTRLVTPHPRRAPAIAHTLS